MKTFLVTGGAGFIGSNFILKCRRDSDIRVVNVDKLTYAGNPENLAGLSKDPAYVFVRGDICDRDLVKNLFNEHRPDAVINFAAESHVDRSIDSPSSFVQTNIDGTFCLLEGALGYWRHQRARAEDFRFLHISTDEVFGSLKPDDPPFEETTPCRPNSPYAASKAAADHLVGAYFHTYGLPCLITNCSNNYGPRQFPEKLIPLMIINAMEGKPLPIYGDGSNVRDWLYVDDHCVAISTVLDKGIPGESYNIGGDSEKNNNDVVDTICRLLDEMLPDSPNTPHKHLIKYVKDRPGHDLRYAMNFGKIKSELGWCPEETFETGLKRTVAWYLENPEWISSVQSGEYMRWVKKQYQER